MNNFQLTGYVRDMPQVEQIKDDTYMAFILSSNLGQTNIPIYLKGNALKKFKKRCSVGSLINVNGKIVSETILNEDCSSVIRLYLVCEDVERLEAPKIKFNRNIVLTKLLDLDEPTDLFKNLRRRKK